MFKIITKKSHRRLTLCGDRWFRQATVERGQVLDSNGVTAIGHRKSSGQYENWANGIKFRTFPVWSA